jgi:hypothetical protein
MIQHITCPHCGAGGRLPEHAAGGRLRCARCHAVFPNLVSGTASGPPVWRRAQRLLPSRGPSRKALLIAAGVIAALLLVGLAVWLMLPSSPSDLIVGRWQRVLSDGLTPVLSFAPDGTLTVTAMGQRVEGKYRFVDRDHMEIELSGVPLPGSPQGKMRVEFPRKGVLVLAHDNGMRVEWQAVE